MKSVIPVLFSLLLIAGQIEAQDSSRRKGPRGDFKIKVIGQLLDSNSDAPLAYATISIFNAKDDVLVGGGLTGDDGSFDVETKPGKLYAIAEYISYEALRIDDIPFEKGKKVVDLGNIYMVTDAVALSTVEIRAEKSETQFSLDKKIFNVGKDLANRGGSAEEILDNVPSVAVDIEGNVSLRGSGNVRILIDGRPSGLVGGGNSNGLRQLPANMIDKVEVITNPSAKYEAEGMSGIINIVLKKENRSGYNSTIEASAGYPEMYGLNYIGNYRKGATNFFASYGFSDRRNSPGGGTREQVINRSSSTYFSNQIRDISRNGFSHNIRGGMDLSISDMQTLTGSITYRYSDENNNSIVSYTDRIGDVNGSNVVLSNFSERLDDELENEDRLEYTLNYTNRLNDSGKELSAIVQYRNDNETESSDFTQKEFLDINIPTPEAVVFQRSRNAESQGNYLFQLDFTNPFSKDHRLEFGARANLRSINNAYIVEDSLENVWIKDVNFSNDFNYDEDVFALYSTYGNKLNKMSYQLGLRLEYSHVITELEQTDEINDRDYYGLFPSVHVNYEINPGNAFQVSYSRRLRRPRFWDLNPFFTFSDNRNFFSGNPNLDPEYTNAYEVGHIKYWDGLTLSSSLFWRHSYDVIERLQISNGDGTTKTQPENLSERDDYGLDINASFSKLDWWRLDGNVNLFRTQTDGTNIDQDFNADGYTTTGRLTNRITALNDTDFQLRMNYRGPRVTTQGKRNAMASIDLGISKDFLNKKLTLTFSARDLLNSRKRIWETELNDFYEKGDFQWRARTFRLTAAYKIINDKQKKGKRGGRRNGQQGGNDFEGGEF